MGLKIDVGSKIDISVILAWWDGGSKGGIYRHIFTISPESINVVSFSFSFVS
jgi:hypothetical protein